MKNDVALDHGICYQIVRMIIKMIDPYYVLETETKCKFFTFTLQFDCNLNLVKRLTQFFSFEEFLV